MENTVDSGLNKENIPLYMRVYEYYNDLITEGKLSPGARLPDVYKRQYTLLLINQMHIEMIIRHFNACVIKFGLYPLHKLSLIHI